MHKCSFAVLHCDKSALGKINLRAVRVLSFFNFFCNASRKALLPVAPPAPWCSLSPRRSSCSHRCCCCCRRLPARPPGSPSLPLPPPCCLPSSFPPQNPNAAATMTGIAAASFFSNACRFGGCGLHFDSLAELIVHIEDNHIGKRLCWLAMAEPRRGGSGGG